MTAAQDEAEDYVEQGDTAYKDADWNQALSLYKKAMAVAEGLDETAKSDVYFSIGACYAKLDDPDTAKEQFELGGWRPSDYADYIEVADGSGDDFDLAVEAYMVGNYTYAAELFEGLRGTSLGDAEREREVHWNLGMTYYHLDRSDAALAEFKAGNYSEAEYGPVLEAMTTPDRLDTGDGSQHFDLGVEAMNSDNYQLGAESFRQVLQGGATGDMAKEARWNLAMCLFHLGDFSGGEEEMKAGGYDEGEYRELRDAIRGSS